VKNPEERRGSVITVTRMEDRKIKAEKGGKKIKI
jgi:hypothetical protein